MRLLLAVLLVGVPSAAFAQISAIELKVNEQESVIFSGDDCGVEINIRVPAVITTGSFVCDPLEVWLSTDSSCPNDPPASAEVLLSDSEPDTEQTVRLSVSELPLFGDGGSCGSAQVEETFRVCARITTSVTGCGAGEVPIRETTPPTITFDSRPPPAPTLTDVEPINAGVSVGVSFDEEDTSTVIVMARNIETGEVTTRARGVPIGSRIQVTGLEVGVEHEITAVAEDEVGNRSEPSESLTAIPIRANGFMAGFNAAGGGETGGCGAAGLMPSGAALMVLGMWFISRRRSGR